MRETDAKKTCNCSVLGIAGYVSDTISDDNCRDSLVRASRTSPEDYGDRMEELRVSREKSLL